MKVEEVEEIVNEYVTEDLCKVVEMKEEIKSNNTMNSNISISSNKLDKEDYIEHIINKVVSERESLKTEEGNIDEAIVSKEDDDSFNDGHNLRT